MTIQSLHELYRVDSTPPNRAFESAREFRILIWGAVGCDFLISLFFALVLHALWFDKGLDTDGPTYPLIWIPYVLPILLPVLIAGAGLTLIIFRALWQNRRSTSWSLKLSALLLTPLSAFIFECLLCVLYSKFG